MCAFCMSSFYVEILLMAKNILFYTFQRLRGKTNENEKFILLDILFSKFVSAGSCFPQNDGFFYISPLFNAAFMSLENPLLQTERSQLRMSPLLVVRNSSPSFFNFCAVNLRFCLFLFVYRNNRLK